MGCPHFEGDPLRREGQAGTHRPVLRFDQSRQLRQQLQRRSPLIELRQAAGLYYAERRHHSAFVLRGTWRSVPVLDNALYTKRPAGIPLSRPLLLNDEQSYLPILYAELLAQQFHNYSFLALEKSCF